MSSRNITRASREWATRPVDERFWSVRDMYEASYKGYQRCQEADIYYGDLRVEAVDGELALLGSKGVPARLNNWSFSQLATRAGAPGGYLEKLPATLASQNLNHGLKARGNGDKAVLLVQLHETHIELRGITSSKYRRLWDWEMAARLMDMESRGWRTPPARPAFPDQPGTRPATKADLLKSQGIQGLSVREGDLIAPAGVYRGDRDFFVFLINEACIDDDGLGSGLGKGFMIWGSEVYGTASGGMEFFYRTVCGNHIVWGASGVQEFRFPHVGAVRRKSFQELKARMRNASERSSYLTMQAVKAAQNKELGKDEEAVIDAAYKVVNIPKKTLKAAYQTAVVNEATDGNPRSVWGLVNGITRTSQSRHHGAARSTLDREAGKLMKMAF